MENESCGVLYNPKNEEHVIVFGFDEPREEFVNESEISISDWTTSFANAKRLRDYLMIADHFGNLWGSGVDSRAKTIDRKLKLAPPKPKALELEVYKAARDGKELKEIEGSLTIWSSSRAMKTRQFKDEIVLDYRGAASVSTWTNAAKMAKVYSRLSAYGTDRASFSAISSFIDDGWLRCKLPVQAGSDYEKILKNNVDRLGANFLSDVSLETLDDFTWFTFEAYVGKEECPRDESLEVASLIGNINLLGYGSRLNSKNKFEPYYPHPLSRIWNTLTLAADHENIGVCAREKCGKVFISDKKGKFQKKYCSETCRVARYSD